MAEAEDERHVRDGILLAPGSSLTLEFALRQGCKTWGSKVFVVALFTCPSYASLYGPEHPFPLYLHQLIWCNERNSFQGLPALALTERGLKPLEQQTVQILHGDFMQITFWQLPLHRCALVCQPV